MQDVLEDENIEMMDLAIEYKELMCRIASAVANAKDKITVSDSKWLSKLSTKF